ncbi:hypothetical protein AKJ64_03875 [candidate division MSBL1 archaeon SCGC-AAA259E17]|uniref:Uncharacterized protein n=1 Tax=candidate division MSBL1 archaeon SCGC-AAA259E17 TaxID=1698263 RepID=A0A133UD96_9EURY|nr:hypothetical protein AKJ64_03875 [candidate division MSBL1 archaeon SCGC-AAA259E17]
MATINLIHTVDAYVFKHRFEGEDAFDELRDYYGSFKYKFEVEFVRSGRSGNKFRQAWNLVRFPVPECVCGVLSKLRSLFK